MKPEHLDKAKELVCGGYHEYCLKECKKDKKFLTCKLMNNTAKALEEAEEKGYNDAFNDIIFRKGIIKKVKGRKYIYFKVAMSDVKKCVQRWKNETK